MQIPPALLQFAGSLVAILVLAAIAARLRLGPERHLASEDESRAVAQETWHGFDPADIALDREGRGALLVDDAGRVMLLRPHGTHFAGRLLTPAARAREEDGRLIVDTAERRFGAVTLDIEGAAAWARRIDALQAGRDA